MVICREVRGPVTHLDNFRVADLEGVAVVAYGSRLETYSWTGTQLQRTAFYNAPILITSAAVIKKFVLLGDVAKGLIFVQATQGGRQLSELGRVCLLPRITLLLLHLIFLGAHTGHKAMQFIRSCDLAVLDTRSRTSPI